MGERTLYCRLQTLLVDLDFDHHPPPVPLATLFHRVAFRDRIGFSKVCRLIEGGALSLCFWFE